ncbi:MAG: hypothetical protein U9R60_11315 [Bacteroidota bacterium]|nr:hypothetical protein [Bacteroidota bacterium]
MPYEINSTWWSAINSDIADEDIALQIKRFLASRSIALVLQGVPGVYVHGAAGTHNDHERVRKTGVKRDVNRGVIDSTVAAERLEDPNSKGSLMRPAGSKMHLARTRHRAFHPHGDLRVLMVSPDVFTVLRASPEGDGHIFTMTNVTDRVCIVEISLSELNVEQTRWHDLLGEKEWAVDNEKLTVVLQPFDVVWLKAV